MSALCCRPCAAEGSAPTADAASASHSDPGYQDAAHSGPGAAHWETTAWASGLRREHTEGGGNCVSGRERHLPPSRRQRPHRVTQSLPSTPALRQGLGPAVPLSTGARAGATSLTSPWWQGIRHRAPPGMRDTWCTRQPSDGDIAECETQGGLHSPDTGRGCSGRQRQDARLPWKRQPCPGQGAGRGEAAAQTTGPGKHGRTPSGITAAARQPDTAAVTNGKKEHGSRRRRSTGADAARALSSASPSLGVGTLATRFSGRVRPGAVAAVTGPG